MNNEQQAPLTTRLRRTRNEIEDFEGAGLPVPDSLELEWELLQEEADRYRD